MTDIFEISKILVDLNDRLLKVENSIQNIVGLEKNNLDRIQSTLILASRIFGDQVTIEQCLEEIAKLKELGMTSVE